MPWPTAVASGRSALVPTMGALHAGHASLMARARQEVGPDAPVVASIFVNPMQFAPGEDLDRYPRTFDADLEVCAEQGVDVVFAPSVEEVYPGGDPQVTRRPRAARRGAGGQVAARPTSTACSPSSPSSSAWSAPTSRCSARRTTSSSP